MKKIISTILTFIFTSTLVNCEEPPLPPLNSYQFLYDRNFTPFAGGENLLTLHRGLEKLDEHSQLNEKSGFLAGLARASELILGWAPINYMTTVVQHEVFGHGYRIRDLGKDVATVIKYSFNTPPPFGPGGASTQFSFKKPPSFTQYSSVVIGGVEATGILAHQLRMQWVKTDKLPAQEAGLYQFSQHDIYNYINSVSKDFSPYDLPRKGHDIESYLYSLHHNYPKGNLSATKLKKMAKISYLDPFTYLSAVSWVKYVFTGKETAVPMFKFKSLSYLPSPRLTLSPFGPEYRLDNYFKYNDVPAYAYIKQGEFAGNKFWGFGLLSDALFTYKEHTFGARLDLWHQPVMLSINQWLTAYDHEDWKTFSTKRFGAAGSLIYNYSVLQEKLTMHVELGYKSAGYLAGESLREGLLTKLALNARF